MMNTIQTNKLNMDELATVSGGGFFDFISDVVEATKDFVVDTVEDMKVPATSVTEFIGEGLLDKLAKSVGECIINNKNK